MIEIILKDKVWIATKEGGIIEYDNDLPSLFKTLERRATDIQQEILDREDLVKCECGKNEDLSDARMDSEGLWTCKECILEANYERQERKR